VNNILFSIIIPVYNREKVIGNAISSILNQDYSSYEIIIINDGSEDDTLNSLEEFKGKIKIINLQKNSGPGFARNRGIEIATGEWLCFLDSDDTFHNQKLSKISNITNLEKHNCIVHNNILSTTNVKIKKYIKNGTFSFILKSTMIYYNSVISLSSAIVKKEFLLNNGICFNENKKFLGKEDYLFWLNIITKNHKIFFFNNYLSTINIGNDNLTNYNNMNIISIKEHLKVLMFLKNKEKIKFIFKNVLISKFIIMYYKNKNYLAIIRLFKTKKNKIINAIAVFLFLKFVLFLYRLN
jgi:glycosyltransferase involved in cell wall biosynthesis